ncbi:hypothetical protein [Lysobacter gummosus]
MGAATLGARRCGAREVRGEVLNCSARRCRGFIHARARHSD